MVFFKHLNKQSKMGGKSLSGSEEQFCLYLVSYCSEGLLELDYFQ